MYGSTHSAPSKRRLSVYDLVMICANIKSSCIVLRRMLTVNLNIFRKFVKYSGHHAKPAQYRNIDQTRVFTLKYRERFLINLQ